MPYLNVKQGCEVGRAQLGCLGNVQEVQVQPKVVVPGSDCTSTGGSQGWKEKEGGGGGGGGGGRREAEETINFVGPRKHRATFTHDYGMFLCQNWHILETIFYQLWHKLKCQLNLNW